MGFRRIGIAGYMGAGKTAATRLLSKNGAAAVIDADYEAKMVMTEDPSVEGRLVREFGDSIMETGRLSFRTLGNIVFASKEKLLRLNEAVHPPLVERLRRLLAAYSGRSVILDAAVLPLWNLESLFDECFWIHAPFELRLERLKKVRRDLDVRTLRERMRVQEECLPAPVHTPWKNVLNDGSLENLSEVLGV